MNIPKSIQKTLKRLQSQGCALAAPGGICWLPLPLGDRHENLSPSTKL